MHIIFAPRGILQIDNARITFLNFKGEKSKYNPNGNREFSLVIEPGRIDNDEMVLSAEEIRDILKRDTNQYGVGWNIKTKPPRDEDDTPFIYMPVKLKMNDSTTVYLKTGDKLIQLDDESVGMLDDIDIANVDLDIRPYDDTMPNGTPFRAAYVKAMCVTQNINRFAARYE